MKRIHLMDELRGFAVFCMVFYHGFYTLAFLMNQSWGEWLYRFFMPAEPWFGDVLEIPITQSGKNLNLLFI